MKCEDCGFNNRRNVYFCSYCGRRIVLKDQKIEILINKVYSSIVFKVIQNNEKK